MQNSFKPKPGSWQYIWLRSVEPAFYSSNVRTVSYIADYSPTSMLHDMIPTREKFDAFIRGDEEKFFE